MQNSINHFKKGTGHKNHSVGSGRGSELARSTHVSEALDCYAQGELTQANIV